MKKRDVQMILIVLGVIAFLVFLISLLFKALNVSVSQDKNSLIIDSELLGGKTEISKEDQEKIDKYTLYMENAYTKELTIEQRKAIIDLIDEVINALNTKNYTLLYSKLNYLYVDAMFSNQEDFNEYVENITYGATDYTCLQYNAKYYGYECILTSESQNTTVEIQISPLNEEFSEYELSFRKDLVDVNERLKNFYVSGISGMIEYEFECANTLEYIGTIRNTTKNNITCSFGDSNAESYFGKYKLISPTSDLVISAGETKDITFVFDVASTVDIRPHVLNIYCKIGEKVENVQVFVDTSEDDIGI